MRRSTNVECDDPNVDRLPVCVSQIHLMLVRAGAMYMHFKLLDLTDIYLGSYLSVLVFTLSYLESLASAWNCCDMLLDALTYFSVLLCT